MQHFVRWGPDMSATLIKMGFKIFEKPSYFSIFETFNERIPNVSQNSDYFDLYEILYVRQRPWYNRFFNFIYQFLYFITGPKFIISILGFVPYKVYLFKLWIFSGGGWGTNSGEFKNDWFGFFVAQIGSTSNGKEKSYQQFQVRSSNGILTFETNCSL